MTKLSTKMIEDIQLRGFAKSTQESYVRAIKLLALHYKKASENLSEEEIRQYFLYNENVRKWSRSACNIAWQPNLSKTTKIFNNSYLLAKSKLDG